MRGKKYKYFGYILIICFLSFTSNLEGQSNIDSLKTLFYASPAEQTDSFQIARLHAIAIEYKNNNLDSALHYGLKSEVLSQQRNDPPLLIKSKLILIQIFTGLTQYDKAKEKKIEIFQICNANDGKEYDLYRLQCLINSSATSVFTNQAEVALKEIRQAIWLARRLEENELLGDALLCYSMIQPKLVEKSLDSSCYYVYKAKSFYELQPIPYKKDAKLKLQIARCYHIKGKYEQAGSAYLEAFEIASKKKDSLLMYAVLFQLGQHYQLSGQPEKALKSFQKALQFPDVTLRVQSYMLSMISEIYEKRNQYDSAYHYLMLHTEQREAYLSEEKEKQLQALEVSFQTKEKERENAMLSSSNQALRLQNQLYSFGFISVILFLVFITYFTISLRQKKRLIDQQHRDYKKVNQEKQRLASIFLHDLQTPLNTLQLGLHRLNRQQLVTPAGSVAVSEMQNDLKTIQELSQQAFNVENIEEESSIFQAVPVDFVGTLESVVASFHSILQYHKITINIQIAEDQLIGLAHPILLERIFTNLLSNAIKYSPNGSQIDIRLLQKETSIEFSIKDQGIGISPNAQEIIFEKGSRLSSNVEEDQSMGFGLYFVKQTTEQLGAKIFLESMPGKGSQFTLQFLKASVKEVGGRKT